MEIKFHKFISLFTIIALVFVLAGPRFANAASLSSISDIMSREKVSTKSTHRILFTSTTAMVASGTIAINFTTFTGTVAVADVQICHGTTGIEHGTAAVTGTSCTATDETVTSSNGASTVWGASYSGTTLTLTAPSGSWTNLVTAGQKVTVFITATNITNPSSVSTPGITITGSNSDTGTFTVPIVDDDSVSVTATVNQTITFDINASLTGSSTSAPYSVPLGTLTSGAVTESNGTSINEVSITGGTNAAGGMAVSVNNANGVNGLKSTSTPADTIPSATGTMAAGTPNYGLCVATSGLVGWTRAGSYGTTCASNSGTNAIIGLTTAPAAFLSSAGPLASTAYANVIVNAAISAATPAHTDYADTLFFEATSTF